ncbi:MAG TPA: acylneuraminate cytidylyltransferase, partial [Elusimicrobia bacterium]|nr:acylneuraminate cytidylyltransferase [Elusimicrobiota bacterium]
MKKRKIVAIIQARMDSTRLPGKTLMSIGSKPLLWHVVERTGTSRYIDDIVIATSTNEKDDKIEKFAIRNNIKISRGPEDDCLDRYYKAAKKFNADIVVRITADCPLICPEVIDEVLKEYIRGGYDYVTNTLRYTYPDGCDVEVFSFKALEKASKECKDPVDREHVTPYIRNSRKFKTKNVENDKPVDPNEYKWSVDRIEDLKFVKEVYKHLYNNGKIFSYKQIMNLLKNKPGIKKINSKVIV